MSRCVTVPSFETASSDSRNLEAGTRTVMELAPMAIM